MYKYTIGATLTAISVQLGGWVRDKLLGEESDDIDIAVSDMTGQGFAMLLHEYLVSVGIETSNIGVIQANPDQSKHLETATIRIEGHWIDFANLRKEVYLDHSRIPIMEFGTPYEDACVLEISTHVFLFVILFVIFLF